MAEFYPAHFPENDNDDHRSGEEKVYRALKTSLRGPYKVFYSVKWLARQGEDDEARDGESDFVIVHPQHGILVMEVKGGGIRREGNRWVSIDSQRRKHWIKDPYEQAMVSKYALIKKIKSLPEWKDRWIDAGHAVVFPDCARPEHSLGLDAPGEITAFAEDLDEIERHVDSMYAYWKTERKNEDPLTNADVASICQLLAPSFELRRPLAAAVHEATREIITLTREQFRVLDYLSRTPRVIITGAAGTGKSTLALEKARRLSREGFETLLVCVSPALAAFFQRDFDGQSNHTDIHSLQELALSENNKNHPLYDAIIADEAQEFPMEAWRRLDGLLRKRNGGGIFYIFADDNGLIHNTMNSASAPDRGTQTEAADDTDTDSDADSDSDSRAASHSHTSSSTDAEHADGFLSAIFPDFVRIPLTENLRNSAPIYELIRKYYHGAELKGSGPDGNPIRTVAAETDDEMYHALNKTLRELIRKDRIAPNNIAILTGQDIQNSLLKDRTMVGEYNVQALTDVLQKNETVEHTLYATIDQFKGVETPVVILIEMDALLSRGDDRSVRQVYTAITRAQVQLIVIARRKHLDRLLRGF